MNANNPVDPLSPDEMSMMVTLHIDQFIGLYVAGVVIDHLQSKVTEWFRVPYYNSVAWQCIKALQENKFLWIADIVGQSGNVYRRSEDLRNHRDVLCHPLRYYLSRKTLQPFLNAKRDRRDNRAAILWDLRKEVEDASTKKSRQFGFYAEATTLTKDAFDQTLKAEFKPPTIDDAGQLLLSAWDKLLPALEANPAGQGKEPDMEQYKEWIARFKAGTSQ